MGTNCAPLLADLFLFCYEKDFIMSITKTRLFKYTEKFTTKKWKFSDKKTLICFIFLLKT